MKKILGVAAGLVLVFGLSSVASAHDHVVQSSCGSQVKVVGPGCGACGKAVVVQEVQPVAVVDRVYYGGHGHHHGHGLFGLFPNHHHHSHWGW